MISVAANEIPREMAELTRAALNHDWETARRIHRKYLPLMQANFIESNPMPVKAVLAMMGRIEEAYRLPHGSDAARYPLQAAKDRDRSRSGGEACSRHSRHGRVLYLRKLAGWAAQDRPAPILVRAMQPWKRPARRPRPQPRALAWTLCHAVGGPQHLSEHAGCFDSERMQVHLRDWRCAIADWVPERRRLWQHSS